MPHYSYNGLDASGKSVKGQMEAANEKAAVQRLREQSVFVLKIREGGNAGRELSFGARIRSVFQILNPRRFLPVWSGDLIVFFQQIALMLRAGFTLVSALEAALGMQEKFRLVRSIDRMTDSIRAGTSLSACMAAEKGLFPPMVVSLVGIGEQSGNLDMILDRMAENLEREKDLKRQLLSAMLYPSIVLLSSVALVAYLVLKVIPRFATFLSGRGSALPASTQMLLDISDWALRWGGLIASILGATIFLILAAYTTKAGKRVVDGVIVELPVVGKAVQFSAMAQTGWSLSLLLRSGIPAMDSLRINGEAMGNAAIGESFERAAAGLLVGQSLSRTIDQPHIPPMMCHMASVGEKSGELDAVMNEVGRYYQRELAAKVKFMSVMIEPLMILSVGGLVGFVYYSIFQAVMSVSKGGM